MRRILSQEVHKENNIQAEASVTTTGGKGHGTLATEFSVETSAANRGEYYQSRGILGWWRPNPTVHG